MGFFKRLFGGADVAPPAPVSRGAIPQVSFDRQALETLGVSLPFGTPLAQARVFGPPDQETVNGGLAQLTYTAWGLALEFERGQFVQASFDLNPETADHPGDAFGASRIKGPDDDALTGETTKADLLRRFGTPARLQELGTQTILYYHHGPLVSEFQLDDEGLLATWDVYLD